MELGSIFKFLRLDNLINSLSGYIESRVALLKLELREEVIKIVSQGLMIAVLVLLALMFLVFFSIGLANFISARYGDTFTGYWIVSGSYAFICLILISFRKNIAHFIEESLKEHAKRHKGK